MSLRYSVTRKNAVAKGDGTKINGIPLQLSKASLMQGIDGVLAKWHL